MQLKPEELSYELCLSRNRYNTTAWQMAAVQGHVKVLEKLCDWANEIQLKREELRNEVWLSKSEFQETAWHMAAGRDLVEVSPSFV